MNDLKLPITFPVKYSDPRLRWLSKVVTAWLRQEMRRNALGVTTSLKLDVMAALLREGDELSKNEDAYDKAGKDFLEACRK